VESPNVTITVSAFGCVKVTMYTFPDRELGAAIAAKRFIGIKQALIRIEMTILRLAKPEEIFESVNMFSLMSRGHFPSSNSFHTALLCHWLCL
jgi:hypothetical protein